jgi:DNA-directed RNA polymerase subunit M/transcription elongation factor TFIIS
MVPKFVPSQKCPQCGSDDYLFRGRKRIAAEPEKGQKEAVETKYRCKPCGHEWRVRVVASA